MAANFTDIRQYLKLLETRNLLYKDCLPTNYMHHGALAFRLVSHLQKQRLLFLLGRVAQSVARLTQEPEVLDSIPGPATYFRFSFCWFKKGSCQLLAKVCARSTG